MMKRGLSNLVTTVLIVLVSLVVVAIIWAFLSPVFERSGLELQTQTLCSGIEFSPQKCLRIIGGGAGGGLDQVLVRARVDKGEVAGWIATVEYNDQQMVPIEQNEPMSTYETRVIDEFTANDAESWYPVKARAAALVELDNGEIVDCPESDIEVMCGVARTAGDDLPCTSDEECGEFETCEDGVCTFYDDEDDYCVDDDDCASNYDCVSGYCVYQGSAGGGGGGGGGTPCADADGDGYKAKSCGGSDCDDTNQAIKPGATEICSGGIDEDCDGNIDVDDSDCSSATCVDLGGQCASDCYGSPEVSGAEDCGGEDMCCEINDCGGLGGSCATDGCGGGTEESDGNFYCSFGGLGDVCCVSEPSCPDGDGDDYGVGCGGSCIDEGCVYDEEDCDDEDEYANVDKNWYLDGDGDGYADQDADPPVTSCVRPADRFSEAELLGLDDCDDGDEYEYPGQRWYFDQDGDNYTHPAPDGTIYEERCPIPFPDIWIPSEWVLGEDCLDINENVNPGQEEDCDNGWDDDCNGFCDYPGDTCMFGGESGDPACVLETCADAGGQCSPGDCCPGFDCQGDYYPQGHLDSYDDTCGAGENMVCCEYTECNYAEAGGQQVMCGTGCSTYNFGPANFWCVFQNSDSGSRCCFEAPVP